MSTLQNHILRIGSICLMLHGAMRETRAQQQYLAVNIIPGEHYEEVFQQVRQLRDPKRSGHIRVGISAVFSYLNESRDSCRARLIEFLSLAEWYDIPIVVQLDGEQWWEARPDLWNWWDSTRAGYNPQNRRNVEWTGWGPEHAMKIAWRNWGRQIRVLPPPNFMSPAYREACHKEMRALVPLVLQWWKKLPEDKRSLFIGIKLGWESAIGVNSFYYPDGNALLNRPESEDPQYGLKAELVPDRGVVAIGYAAVTTAGLAHSGVLKESDLEEIVHRHLEDICALAAEMGVPRDKLFTHVGGWKEEELLYDAAYNKYSCPGWSFYRHAADPTKDKGVLRVLRTSNAPYWAAVEWLLEHSDNADAWKAAIAHTLSDPKCRYMDIYNWSGIRDNHGAVTAIEAVLGMKPRH